MSLPAINEIAQKCKRRKSEIASITSSLESVSSADLFAVENLEKVPRVVKEFWLVARYGFECVNVLCSLPPSIPESVTDAQRRELVVDLCGSSLPLPKAKEELNKLIGFILTECDHLLQCQPMQTYPPILAPPTSRCYDCGRRLVSNHKADVSVMGII